MFLGHKYPLHKLAYSPRDGGKIAVISGTPPKFRMFVQMNSRNHTFSQRRQAALPRGTDPRKPSEGDFVNRF